MLFGMWFIIFLLGSFIYSKYFAFMWNTMSTQFSILYISKTGNAKQISEVFIQRQDNSS